MNTTVLQRVEAAAVAVVAAVTFCAWGHAWWWLLVLFVAFDLSAVGYLHGPRLGAILYNIGHSFTLPAAVGVVAVLIAAFGHHSDVLAVIVGCWVFHIAVDRALGYGLKESSGFTHTHLGH